MPDLSARLREFLRERAIRPEPQWCHDLPDGFDHWPSTLRQRISVTGRGEGVLGLSAVSDCVRGVTDAPRADALCVDLTALAGGWSFVHDEAAAVVVVTVGGVVAADDEAVLACWLDAAVLSAWHAWSVADALARAVGGEAAVTAPAGIVGPRTEVDGLLRLPESLRSRPEWVFDPEQLRLVALPQLAEDLAGGLDAPLVVAGANHEGCRLEVAPREGPTGSAPWPSELVLELIERPGIGRGLQVRAGGPCRNAGDVARELSGLTAAGEIDLAPGVWTTEPESLWFGMFAAEFTVSRLLRGDDGSLAGVADLAGAVWQSAAAVAEVVAQLGADDGADRAGDPVPGAASGLPDDSARALSIHASTWQPALTAVGQALRGLGPVGSDDRLLWLPEADGETVTHIATWGRLDPPGPALTTLLLVGGPAVQAKLLVVLDRHPTAPHHRVCAAIGEGGSLTQAVHDVAQAELRYLPGFVDQTDAPDALREAAAVGLMAAVGAATQGDHATGAGGDPQPQDGRSTGAGAAAAGDVAAQWWLSASDQENVLQHYLALPAAWDAALGPDPH